eukprot:TRINITY_DN1422_c0_g1_i5.p1 TRINITY_DN1422_c0_g1~~TRINITY_DN1422_c0_g1_i5.p1  ORF type:complete len:1016 (+),score=275.90 TRINITY_DN1422_c0_g1_i5:2164-5211(+)
MGLFVSLVRGTVLPEALDSRLLTDVKNVKFVIQQLGECVLRLKERGSIHVQHITPSMIFLSKRFDVILSDIVLMDNPSSRRIQLIDAHATPGFPFMPPEEHIQCVLGSGEESKEFKLFQKNSNRSQSWILGVMAVYMILRKEVPVLFHHTAHSRTVFFESMERWKSLLSMLQGRYESRMKGKDTDGRVDDDMHSEEMGMEHIPTDGDVVRAVDVLASFCDSSLMEFILETISIDPTERMDLHSAINYIRVEESSLQFPYFRPHKYVPAHSLRSDDKAKFIEMLGKEASGSANSAGNEKGKFRTVYTKIGPEIHEFCDWIETSVFISGLYKRFPKFLWNRERDDHGRSVDDDRGLHMPLDGTVPLMLAKHIRGLDALQTRSVSMVLPAMICRAQVSNGFSDSQYHHSLSWDLIVESVRFNERKAISSDLAALSIQCEWPVLPSVNVDVVSFFGGMETSVLFIESVFDDVVQERMFDGLEVHARTDWDFDRDLPFVFLSYFIQPVSFYPMKDTLLFQSTTRKICSIGAFSSIDAMEKNVHLSSKQLLGAKDVADCETQVLKEYDDARRRTKSEDDIGDRISQSEKEELGRIAKFRKVLKNIRDASIGMKDREAAMEQLRKLCHNSVPHSIRGDVWILLLDVDVEASRKEYSAIDLSQPVKMDRQITLDVLRCHQYHHILSSPEGQDSLRRVLKAWIITHPDLQYWQGLDSICAAFITVTSRDEAVSFGCLKVFVDRFVREFFQSKTSIAMQAHLCIFSQLITYHDPELGKHFKETEFRPEYYAVPWFITAFSHVLSMEKLYPLWDVMLATGTKNFTYFIAVAWLKQMRDSIIGTGMNHMMMFFSELRDANLMLVVDIAEKMASITPKSALIVGDEVVDDDDAFEWVDESWPTMIGVSQFQEQVAPEIALEDLMTTTIPHVSVDIRPHTLAVKEVLKNAIHFPLEDMAKDEKGRKKLKSLMLDTLRPKFGTAIVIIASSREEAHGLASTFIDQGFPHVCVLNPIKSWVSPLETTVPLV